MNANLAGYTIQHITPAIHFSARSPRNGAEVGDVSGAQLTVQPKSRVGNLLSTRAQWTEGWGDTGEGDGPTGTGREAPR